MSDETELEQVDRRCAAWAASWKRRRRVKPANANRAAADREWLLFRAYELAHALGLLLQVLPVDANSNRARKALSSFDGRKR